MTRYAAIIALILLFLSSCARDLSSNTYVSSSTLSLTLEGEVISAREVTIKDSDQRKNNASGILSGGPLGGIAASGIGSGNGSAIATVGGAIAGAIIGTIAEEKLSTSQGLEYIIKVDTSKLKDDYYTGSNSMRTAISSATTSGLITVIQGKDNPVQAGSKVYVIFSENRTRIIPRT